MSSPIARIRLPYFLAVLSAAACGDGISFPDVEPSILAQFCIQGQIAVEDVSVSRSSAISAADCNDGFDDGYYEGWHVRVAETTSVTISVTSQFDSWLEVLRVDDVNQPDSTSTLLAEDDDSGDGLDALVTITLQPDTDYVIFVSGYDDGETGSYALVID